MELCDGHAAPRGDLQEDCLNGRPLPGKGDFDIVRFVRPLEAKGTNVAPSVEVLSPELRKLAPRENAGRTVTAVRKLFASLRTS